MSDSSRGVVGRSPMQDAIEELREQANQLGGRISALTEPPAPNTRSAEGTSIIDDADLDAFAQRGMRLGSPFAELTAHARHLALEACRAARWRSATHADGLAALARFRDARRAAYDQFGLVERAADDWLRTSSPPPPTKSRVLRWVRRLFQGE